jgi:hypothetical protein
VNLERVKRDDWIVGGLALVFVIILVAFPWFSAGGGSVTGISIPSVDLTATDSPDGWLGILAVLCALALIADLAVERLSPDTEVPAISNSRTMTRFVLAIAAAGFMALKFLFHIHFSIFGWGFYAAVVVAAALVYFALQARNAGDVGTTPPARPSVPVGGPAEPPARPSVPVGGPPEPPASSGPPAP